MATAQQLLDLGDALTGVADAITDFVTLKTDPDGPADPDLAHLSNIAAQIAVQANKIDRAGIEALAQDVGSAIDSLNFQVSQAKSAIARIDEIQKGLDVASAVLTAGASIAVSVGTGNWLGVASAVVDLAAAIHKTLSPPPSTTDATD